MPLLIMFDQTSWHVGIDDRARALQYMADGGGKVMFGSGLGRAAADETCEWLAHSWSLYLRDATARHAVAGMMQRNRDTTPTFRSTKNCMIRAIRPGS